MLIAITIVMIGVLIGFIIGKSLLIKSNQALVDNAHQKSIQIVQEANIKSEKLKKEKILQVKADFLELKFKHEDIIKHKEKKIQDVEKKVREKEIKLNEDLYSNTILRKKYEKELANINFKKQKLDQKKIEIDKIYYQQIEILEKISGYSSQQAKHDLIEKLRIEAKNKAQIYIQQVVEEAQLNAKTEAKKILIQTIQRIGTEQAIENSVSVFNIESDEIKGRIIGREGRNIRALESATGVEIIVDDTPEAIILSCFDPVRREIARLSLYRLVIDGRIHPARIEEVVTKVSKQIDEEIIEVGKRTVIDLKIHSLHPELIKIIGRMKYRSSYGQNLLQHSREVAHLSGVMASELGLNAKLAKRAGLLHDIGKVPEQESEFSHALLGMKWAEKYGENPEIINSIGAHHDEIEMKYMLSPIIQVCDGISGARPGARRQIMESYIQRLRDLENVALNFDGVSQAYAIQAGRELRVIVQSEKIDDSRINQLSIDIAEEIQNKLTYPGQVKVTVIRETRAINIAR